MFLEFPKLLQYFPELILFDKRIVIAESDIHVFCEGLN